MAANERDRVGTAIAKVALHGYEGPTQMLVVKRLVSGFDIFVSMPTRSHCAIAYCLRSTRYETFFLLHDFSNILVKGAGVPC